ncbi:MAG: beta-galactosidase [Clostridia bacterium]|nr:beta-galactosidase [Clostridia bacterium]
MEINFRTEYPRPQFVRKDWLCLNGVWDFTIDDAHNGEYLGYQVKDHYDRKINVPYCPQSKLSGIGITEFIKGVWYTRSFNIPADWKANGKRTILHIDACDYFTKVFINSKEVGTHRGGYTAFSFDITDFITEGENRITVNATDDEKDKRIGSGKQSTEFSSYECFYTRTTGIWQTVWLENIPASFIKNVKMTPCAKDGELRLEVSTKNAELMTFKAEVSFKGEHILTTERVIDWDNEQFSIIIPEDKRYLWDTENPNLYDIKFTLGDDVVESYFGLRDIALRKGVTYINGKATFQRLVLDQGFYPDGLYTAPSDAELEADVLRGLEMGFNGARLHMKFFEPRFFYHADRHGYMVWGEYPCWGLDTCNHEIICASLPQEWFEMIMRDYNHPAIIGWCPMNETGYLVDRECTRMLYDITKAYDPNRLFIGVSGWGHVPGTYDMCDTHDYTQDVEEFKNKYLPLEKGEAVTILDGYTRWEKKMLTTNEVCFLSEFGGASWVIDEDKKNKGDWGYGNAPKTEEEFIERYKGLCYALFDNKAIGAFCYTQLYDIEQEINGLYTYDRRPKFDPKVISEITKRKAVVEE